jgi:hypothetical protein
VKTFYEHGIHGVGWDWELRGCLLVKIVTVQGNLVRQTDVKRKIFKSDNSQKSRKVLF